MNKKGYNLDVVVALILAMLVILLLFPQVLELFGFLKETGEELPCSLSVVAASIKPAGQSLIDIHCPAREVVLDDDKLYLGNSYNEDRAKRAYAEEMRKCWNKMGEGNLEPFSEGYLSSVNICVICSKIEIDERLVSEVGLINDFWLYLNETAMFDIPEKNNVLTYADYMSKTIRGTKLKFFWHDTGWGTQQETLNFVDRIDPREKHLTVFTLKTKPAFESIPFIGMVPDIIVDWDAIPAIFLVREENFNTLNCQRVYQ